MNGDFRFNSNGTDISSIASPVTPTSVGSEFTYQTDALSLNWEAQVASYLDWVTHRTLVTSNTFEAEALIMPPQVTAQMSLMKVMVEAQP